MDFEYMSEEDFNKRDSLIFGNDKTEYFGGIESFGYQDHKGISYTTAEELMELGFLDPNDRQNSAPTAEEFVNFCKKYSQYESELIGYAVAPRREDCRVSIEGFIVYGVPEEDTKFLRDFEELTYYADEKDMDPDTYGNYDYSCWYD